MNPRLSVCFGTLNRRSFLKKAIASIRQSVKDLAYEIVIAIPPCVDGSLTFLREENESKHDLIIIEEPEKRGAVAGFNAAFEKARGEYVAAFNDDAEYQGDELWRACKLLDERPEVGQVAIPFSLPHKGAHVDVVNLWGLRLPYANFGVIRRELGQRLGWWGEHYQYAGDTELSIKVWNSNYRVAPLIGGHIVHAVPDDDTRIPNVESKSLQFWNDTPPPRIVQEMRKGQPKLPTSKNRMAEKPRIQRPNKSQRHKLAGIEGMSLVKYTGERGLQVRGTPSGAEYKFSGGACLYVDDRDLIYVFSKAQAGESLRVV